MQPKTIEKYFFFGLLFATFIFTFLIFRPFWAILILGISFSIVLQPIYEWIKKILPGWLASLLTVLLFTIILCGPIFAIETMVFNQSQEVYKTAILNSDKGPMIESINNGINSILPSGVTFDINQKITDFISYVTSNIAAIFSGAISAFFSFILMLLIMFYFIKDGAKWKKTLVIFSPLPDKDDEKIITRLVQAVNAVVVGYLFIALIQGLMLGFGFWIFGVPHGALWGTVAAIASLIPTIGTALISIPAIIFLFLTGNLSAAIGLLIWAALAVGMIDNFLSPIVVGTKINISPMLILFSVLGGISLLGPIGILVGPLAISLLYTLISIYRNEFKQNPIL